MSAVIRQLPFYNRPTTVDVAGQRVAVRAHQIIVWVSIRLKGALSPPFPAVLDTGHSQFFSIQAEQLRQWAHVEVGGLQVIGRTRANNVIVQLHAAGLAIHRNRPGARDDLLAEPAQLRIRFGVVVHPEGDSTAPRLPLLGLQSLVENEMHPYIDGKRMLVDIRRGRSRWWW